MTSARGHDAAVRRAKLRMSVRPEEIEGERTAQAPVIQLSPSRGTDHPGCQVIQPAPLGSRDLCVTSARGHDAAVRRAKLRMSVRPEEIEGERTAQRPQVIQPAPYGSRDLCVTSARGHDAAVRRAKLRMSVRPEEIEGERTAQRPQVIQPAPYGSRDLCVTSARGHDAAVRRAKLRMSVRPEEIEGERTAQALRVPSGQAPGYPKVSRQGGTGLVALPAPTRRFEEQNSECPFALRKSKGNGQDRPQVIQPSPSRGTGSPGPSSSLRTGPRLSEGFTPGGTGLVALPAPTWVI